MERLRSTEPRIMHWGASHVAHLIFTLEKSAMRLVTSGTAFAAVVTVVGPQVAVSQSVLETALAATVTIEVFRPGEESSGSGFIVSGDGVIVTAAHVIEDATSAIVRLQTGDEFKVEGVIELDRPKDFALLRIAGFDLPTVPLANSQELTVGQRVLALGAPLGLEATVSDGIVGAIRMTDGVRLIQITAPVSPGSSGGPVVVETGEVIGVVVSGIRGGGAENLNFALPINYVRGSLGLASHKVPSPLADSWRVATSPSGSGAGVSEPGESTAEPVNDALGLSWESLDGLEYFDEERGDDGLRYETTIRYWLSVGPDGGRTLERSVSQYTHQTGSMWTSPPRRAVDFYRWNQRVTIGLDNTRDFEQVTSKNSLHKGIEGFVYKLTIRGGTFSGDSAGIRLTKDISPGVLPWGMVGAAVAALPDSLPRVAHIWIVEHGGVEVPVKIEVIGDPYSVKVPILRSGNPRCGKDAPTDKTAIMAVDIRMTRGAELTHRTVSAGRPHISIFDSGKCVRLPNTPDISGTWTYAATDLTSATTNTVCSLSGTMTIQQGEGASSFSGVMLRHSVDCPGAGEGLSTGRGGNLVDAAVTIGGDVEFSVLDATYQHEGSIADGVLSGSVTFVATMGDHTTHRFDGSWRAWKE